MKRVNGLFSKISDLNNLELAFWKAKKGKDFKKDVRRFQSNLHANLLELRKQLLSGEVKLGHYHLFKIYDPKERIICAADFNERVLHHALMNVCSPYFERHFIFDTYACRLGKGTYKALERAENNQKKYDFFLKIDVRKYFDSIDHLLLKNKLRRLFKDRQLLMLFDKLIDSYSVSEETPAKGLPIGNLTSQYFANFYLSFIDHYVKENLKIPAYVRYMDDIILWNNDKKELLNKGKNLKMLMKNELALDLKQFYLQSSNRGLPFLGFLLKRNKVELQQKTKRRFIKKYVSYTNNFENNIWTQNNYVRHLRPVFAHVNYAETKALRLKILQKREGTICF